MGYTHYWTPKRTNAEKFKDYSNVCARLKKNLPENIQIGDATGDLGSGSQPKFSSKEVCFNGVGDDSHETFNVGLNQNDWDFCKTACKPYDLLVCACLLAAVDMLGYQISSDGDIEDWIPAIKYYNKTINGVNFTESKLTKEFNRK